MNGEQDSRAVAPRQSRGRYLQIVTWQTAALNNQRNDIDILQRRLDASVLLIKALGGGWDISHLPT